jgi:hypothetical protein
LAIAKINYRIPGGTSVQFSFLHVVEPPDTPILPTQFKCTVVHTDTSTLFRLSASLKEIKIDADPIETNRVKVGSKFVVTGKVLSHIAFVSRRGTRFLTEVAHFTMTIKDIDIPEDAKDAFDLAFVYGQNGIGALLREAIPDLVNCDDTCTLQLAE